MDKTYADRTINESSPHCPWTAELGLFVVDPVGVSAVVGGGGLETKKEKIFWRGRMRYFGIIKYLL